MLDGIGCSSREIMVQFPTIVICACCNTTNQLSLESKSVKDKSFMAYDLALLKAESTRFSSGIKFRQLLLFEVSASIDILVSLRVYFFYFALQYVQLIVSLLMKIEKLTHRFLILMTDQLPAMEGGGATTLLFIEMILFPSESKSFRMFGQIAQDATFFMVYLSVYQLRTILQLTLLDLANISVILFLWIVKLYVCGLQQRKERVLEENWAGIFTSFPATTLIFQSPIKMAGTSSSYGVSWVLVDVVVSLTDRETRTKKKRIREPIID